jgi:hypothetical protein
MLALQIFKIAFPTKFLVFYLVFMKKNGPYVFSYVAYMGRKKNILKGIFSHLRFYLAGKEEKINENN